MNQIEIESAMAELNQLSRRRDELLKQFTTAVRLGESEKLLGLAGAAVENLDLLNEALGLEYDPVKKEWW